MKRIQITENDGDITYDWDEEERLVFGRGKKADIVLDEKKISRAHCCLKKERGKIYLEDLDSSNGTYVDGEKVDRVELQEGDTFVLGDVTITFAPGRDEKEEQKKTPSPRSSTSPSDTSVTPSTKTDNVGKMPISQKYVRAGLAIVGLFALLLIGSYFYNRHKARVDARKLLSRIRSLHEEEHEHRKALNLIQDKLLRAYPDTAAAGKARKLGAEIKNVVDEQNNLQEKYQDLIREYRNYHPVHPRQKLAKRREFIQDLNAFKEDHRAFLKKHPNTTGPIGRRTLRAVVNAKIEEVKNRPKDFLREYFSNVRETVSDHLSKRRLGQAVSLAETLKKDLEGTAWADKARNLFEETTSEVDIVYNEVLDRAKKHINEKQYQKALKIYQSEKEAFKGTERFVDLQDLIYETKDLARGKKRKEKRKKRRKRIRKDVLEKLNTARKKQENGRYTEARDIYAAVLERSDLSDVGLSSLKDRARKMKKQIDLLASLKSKFIEAINNGRVSGEWKLNKKVNGARYATIVRAGKTALRLEFGSDKYIKREWDRLDPGQLVRLFRRLDLKTNETFALAKYAWKHDATSMASEMLHQLHQENPDLKSRVYKLVAQWKDTEIPEEGFTYFEKTREFLTPDELRYAELRVERKEILKKVRNGNEKAFQKAFSRFEEIRKKDDVREEFKKNLTKSIRKALLKRRNKLYKELKGVGSRGDVGELRQLKVELNKRRKVAMNLIMDKDLYPYPYDESKFTDSDKQTFLSWIDENWQKVGQTKSERWKNKGKKLKNYLREQTGKQYQNTVQGLVKRLVDWVRLLWNNPGKEIAISATTRDKIETLRTIDEKYLSRVNGSPPEDKSVDAIYGMLNEKVNLKTYALDSSESSRISWNRKVKKYNVNFTKAHDYIKEKELKQVQITNDYRAMMGSHRVTINLKLVKCARKHSEYMKRTGNFSHNEDRAGYETPNDRAQKAGYNGNVSENIHRGSGNPKGAFKSWFGSAGHHRNMVNPSWRCLGSGVAGTFWTQNFGSKQPDLEEYLKQGN